MKWLRKLFKKKYKLTEDNLKWNKMCDMYDERTLPSPYYEIFDYDSGIQGEGHYCYFDNCGDDLNRIIGVLMNNLPPVLKENLRNAYDCYIRLENECDEENDEKTIIECDSVYYKNEKLIKNVLQEYANTLNLSE